MMINVRNKIVRCFLRCLIPACFLLLVACAGMRPDITIPDHPPKPAPLKTQPAVALVLGGGGARGYAHIGALKALRQAHVPVNLIVGTSVGSIIGALYADNQDLDRLDRLMMAEGYWGFADIANVPSLSGLVQGYHLEKFLNKSMKAKTFRQLGIKFVAVTTDIGSGTTYTIESGPIPPAVLASAAFPGVVEPVHLYHRILVDGGVIDNVAIDVAKRYQPKMIIAISLEAPLDKNIPYSSLGILQRSYAVTLRHLAKYKQRGADVFIHPDVLHTNVFDLSNKQALIDSGYRATKKLIPTILKIMKQKGVALSR